MIFVSAKALYLDVENQTTSKFVGLDFKDEAELYFSILTLADYDLAEDKDDDITYLKSCIEDLFNENSCFVIIDDIDTLSTAGKETGMDFLYGVLWRSRKRSKVLYTLRNRPSQSIASSLEIPGMVGDEFERFVDVCADQFNVPAPSKGARESLIWPTSEGRPLVVESIIAIRRTTANYPDAVSLFESEAGNDVRDYVFRREWDALDTSDRGREILAIIAQYDAAIAFDDIVTISRLDASKVRDAIASVQEIFLTNRLEGEETLFSIGALTRNFVQSAARDLDLFETVKTRVSNFKNTFYPDSPALNVYINRFNRAEGAAKRGESRYIIDLVTDMEAERRPKLKEDPRFLSLRGTARILADYRSLPRARSDFEAAMDFKYSPPPDQILTWLRAETDGDSGDAMSQKILDRVRKAKGYDSDFRARVKFQRACYLYGRGRASLSTEPHDATKLLGESVGLHCEALAEFIWIDSSMVSKSQEFCRNTSFLLARHLQSSNDPDGFLQLVTEIPSRGNRIIMDPLIEPIYAFMRWGLVGSTRKEILQRRLSRFDTMTTQLLKSDIWCEREREDELRHIADNLRKVYRQRISSLKT